MPKFFFTVAFAAPLACLTSVATADTIDQDNLITVDGFGISGGPTVGFFADTDFTNELLQTFVVGITGDLTRVQLQLSRNPLATPDFDVDVSIVTLSGTSTPITVVDTLSTTSFGPADVTTDAPMLIDLGFANPASVNAGDTLGILLSPGAPQGASAGTSYRWFIEIADNTRSYVPGAPFSANNGNFVGGPSSDFGFATFVEEGGEAVVPLPASALLLLSGLGALVIRSRR